MIKVKEVFKADPFSGKDAPMRKLLNGFVCAVLGFVFSSTGGSVGMFPLGIGFIPCGGAGGLLGVLWGVWLNGEDIFRYAVASAVNFFSFRCLKDILALPLCVTAFMTTLWSVTFAGLLGIFTVDTTFAENCGFALAGVVAGFFAYVFQVYKKTFSRGRGFEPSSRREYMCCLTAVAAVIFSFSSLGGIWETCTAILAFFCVFTVSSASGFLNSFVFSSVIGFALLLADGKNTVILASLLFGAILSVIVAPLGKYAVFTSYAIAGLIVCIYFRADGLPYPQLFNIIAAGVIFLMVPKNVYLTMTEVLIPQSDNRTKKIKKRRIKRNVPLKAKMKDKHICKTCASCRNRFVCWVKDYGYTSEVFLDFSRNVKRGEPVFPSHFLPKCPNTGALAEELSSAVLNRHGFRLEYTKCSEPKMGEVACGDSCTIFASGEKQIICLADGMGSGTLAAKESYKASRLMEDLICKGVSKEDALRIVNETLVKSEYETVLAVDLAVIDLKTGMCEFVKAGAAPTFVIRNGSLYELGSRSVPVGILDELSLEYERGKLLTGDVLLMVSDGMVADGCEWLRVLISGMSDLETRSPLLLSGNVMGAAKRLNKHLADDITVIAAKLVAL